MFNVVYDSLTGAIVSYQGDASTAPTTDAIPDGCSRLTFATDISGFLNSNGSVIMKVDTVNKILALINPPSIPAPVNVEAPITASE